MLPELLELEDELELELLELEDELELELLELFEDELLELDEEDVLDELLELEDELLGSSVPPQAAKLSARAQVLARVIGLRQSATNFILDIVTYLFI